MQCCPWESLWHAELRGCRVLKGAPAGSVTPGRGWGQVAPTGLCCGPYCWSQGCADVWAGWSEPGLCKALGAPELQHSARLQAGFGWCDFSECLGHPAPLCAGAPGLAPAPEPASLRTAWLLCTVQSPLYCTADICSVMFWGLASASGIWGVQKLDKALLQLQFLLCTSGRAKIKSFFLVSTKQKKSTENQNWMRNITT